MKELEDPRVQTLLGLALEEDLGVHGDVTSRVFIPADGVLGGQLVAREAGVAAGLPLAEKLFGEAGIACSEVLTDGSSFEAGAVLLRLHGPAREVLRLERVVLNFLQRLCGIASKTARFVAALGDSGTQIVDTRKTTPGWRLLEKYAVRQGGGHNHRLHLSALGMVKDNHLSWWSEAHTGRGRQELFALLRARWMAEAPEGVRLQIEVDSVADCAHALRAGCDFLLLDNLDDEALRRCVALRDELLPGAVLEASGGVDLARLPGLGTTGVDRVSIGALTHSAVALDIGLDYWKQG